MKLLSRANTWYREAYTSPLTDHHSDRHRFILHPPFNLVGQRLINQPLRTPHIVITHFLVRIRDEDGLVLVVYIRGNIIDPLERGLACLDGDGLDVERFASAKDGASEAGEVCLSFVAVRAGKGDVQWLVGDYVGASALVWVDRPLAREHSKGMKTESF